jgi:Spy/CpxP family protein refolding chaperone
MSKGKRLIIALAVAAALTIGTTAAAWADASPPTNGGNGAGQSGQCTGNPDDRPPGLSCS